MAAYIEDMGERSREIALDMDDENSINYIPKVI